MRENYKSKKKPMKPISFRGTQSLNDFFEDLAIKNGVNKADLLREAIIEYKEKIESRNKDNNGDFWSNLFSEKMTNPEVSKIFNAPNQKLKEAVIVQFDKEIQEFIELSGYVFLPKINESINLGGVLSPSSLQKCQAKYKRTSFRVVDVKHDFGKSYHFVKIFLSLQVE